jgi:hypothetical protein
VFLRIVPYVTSLGTTGREIEPFLDRNWTEIEGIMNAIEQNKVIIWQMFKVVEQKGFTAQSEFFADQVINHGISVNRDMVRAILQDILNTFPDVKNGATPHHSGGRLGRGALYD